MEQLHGQDAVFLYRETNSAPLHTSKLQIFDPSTTPDGKVPFKAILAQVQSRLHMFPRARQKLVHVPLEVDHPYWVEDSDFDLEFHVRNIALPEPGDWRHLCIQAARLHARPLDMSRPLWEIYVINGLSNVEGLPEGSFAVLTKIHNSALGKSPLAKDKHKPFRPINDAILDDGPTITINPPATNWAPERTPRPAELLVRAWANNLLQPFKLARVMSSRLPELTNSEIGLRLTDLRSIRRVPRTRFNRHVSPHRVIDGAAFDLKILSQIKDVVTGATINDVIISLCGGAVRKYLRAKAELPHQELMALAPVMVERPGGKAQAVNMTLTLGAHEDDALERLEAVRDAARSTGAMDKAIGAGILTDFNEYAPGMTAAIGARMMAGLGFVNRVSPMFNCTINNVPGPQKPLYLCGAKLVTVHGIGPVMDGAGLNFTAFSYCGEVTITLTADRAIVGDPAFFAECLEQAYVDLKYATVARRKRRFKVA